jgi:hypothetical protein
MTTQTAMSSQELAFSLKKCLENQDFETAYHHFYSPDVINEEMMPSPQAPIQTKGIQACMEKNQEWYSTIEVHSMQVSEPLVTDCYFVLKSESDVTNKKTGTRMKLEELALYTVENGKITRETFFHPPENPMKE